jgi:hypothetical protein
MSARAILLATILGSCSLAVADEEIAEEIPEMEFFEYLGMWEETDEEWLMFDELVTAKYKMEPESPENEDPYPEDHEPVEEEDES